MGRIKDDVRRAEKGAAVTKIVTPQSASEMDGVRVLFVEYAASLKIDLAFQNFDAELLGLPGDYVGPSGALLLATVGGEWAGCCAMRRLDAVDYPNACEMKRLYVRPGYRGLRLGRLLAQSILEAARLAAYDCVLLDTLDDMEAARALYRDLGFAEIPPYYFSPIAGAHYLKAEL